MSGSVTRARATDRVREHLVRGRRPALGVAGQLLNAATNVLTAYVASVVLRPDSFGLFALSFACMTVVLAAGRGLIGSTVLVQVPLLDVRARRALVRSAVGFTLAVGLASTLLLLVLAVVALPVLWVFAPWVTAALLQDTGRHVFLAQGRTGSAFLLDAVWAVAQLGAIAVGFLLTDSLSLPLLATAWGVGGLAGAAAFALVDRSPPASAGPWLRTTRDVAGWFTAVSVIGQAEVYLVLVLTGLFVGPAEAGGLRAVQLLAYQPAIVVLGAILTLVTPLMVRAAAVGRGALVSAQRRTILAVSPVVGGLVLLAVLRDPLMTVFFGQYTAFAALVVPIALQGVLSALTVPPTALLRGLRRGGVVFVLQALRSVLLIGGAALGLALGGAVGLVWSLPCTTGLFWGVSVVVARGAVRRDAVA